MALGVAAGPITRSRRSAQPLSNSWLPTADASRSSLFITSMVGWSFATADAKDEAPIRSPAPTTRLESAGASASTVLTVPAHFTVLASIRPWKSLMPTRLIVTSGSAWAGATVPATTASDPATSPSEATRAGRTSLVCRTVSAFRSILSVPSGAYDLLARSRRAARTLGPMVPEGQKFALTEHEMADDPAPRARAGSSDGAGVVKRYLVTVTPTCFSPRVSRSLPR